MKTRVVIIGNGLVGSTTTYTMMLSGIANEIFVIDLNKEKVEGDVLDMNHGLSFLTPVKLSAGDYSDCKEANVVIITAGVAQKEGEDRLDLLKRNVKVFDNIIDQLMKNIGQHTVLLIVTNPVDVLTQYTLAKSGLPRNRVIGSGTVLDTSRLKYAISEHTGIDSRNIHAFVLGEHGDSEVAAFSSTNISGMSLDEYCHQCSECDSSQDLLNDLHEQVKNAAYEIIEKKGSTYYAVALAVNRITEAILHDQRSILTVSTLLEGQYGIREACVSVPCIIGRGGVRKILEISLSDPEREGLTKSAEIVRKEYKGI